MYKYYQSRRKGLMKGVIMKNELATLTKSNFWPRLWSEETGWNKLFDDWFGPSFFNIFNAPNVESYPTDQYWDKDGNLHIEVPLAGYKKEDIELYISGDYLHLHVKKHEKRTDVKYASESIRKKELTRQWFVNDSFDSDIKSTFVDGLLTITLRAKNKKEENKKYIDIE